MGLASFFPALMHSMGSAAYYIWAIGLLAAGQASTMTCTYAGQVIMGGCVEIKLKMWQQVAFTRAFALGPSILVAALTVGNDKLFNDFNEWLNVLQSLQLPFAMLPLLHFCSSSAIMGRFKSAGWSIIVHVCLAALVMIVNAYLVIVFVGDFSQTAIMLVVIYAAIYLYICSRLVFPLRIPTSDSSGVITNGVSIEGSQQSSVSA